jgi:seryl-tRNA synthetase
MIDIRFLREHPDKVKEAARNKNAEVSDKEIDRLLELDETRRRLLSEVEEVRRARNELSDGAKAGKPSAEQVKKGRALKDKLAKHEKEYGEVDAEYLALLKKVPNIPADDVPVGKSEDENQVAKTVGDKPKFDFEPKNHWQIGEARGWIDKERAAKVSGARFAYLKGNLVRLQFALLQFALGELTSESVLKGIADKNKLEVSSRPFVPVLPPLLIKTEPYDAMDRLEPRDDRYKLEGEELWLQGSAEHVLGPMHAGEIFDAKELPLRYVGFATSFRREAGTYGKDMEGILRMHQFDKLEMESFTQAEDSLAEHLFFIAIQEHLLGELEIPYQVIMKCTADIGKPNARGVDLESWLPGQDKYRETHTADYMTDYQARRLQTRVRSGDKAEFVHTNDATALAMGRTLIAIIENNQLKDGRVRVPKVLQQYYGGEVLE